MADNAGPVGIAVDNIGWWVKFEQFAKNLDLDYEVFEIERSDWIDTVTGYSAVLWRPNLDPPFCEEGMEKIYFMEHVLHKRVFPNWATFWHYDNKRAQAYFFKIHNIPSPKTFCSYSRTEAADFIRAARFPLVSKSASGASSEAVHLIRSTRAGKREIRRVFHEPWAIKVLRRLGVQLRLRPDSLRSYILWQEFILDNDSDFRVTVIGKSYVFVFWRKNRPGDFRASGSGLIDYEVSDASAEVELCLDLCRRHDFDSMAFDFVYREGQPILLEMSYAFNDKAIYDAPGHFVPTEDGGLSYKSGHVWPQDLYMRYVRTCLSAQSSNKPAKNGGGAAQTLHEEPLSSANAIERVD